MGGHARGLRAAVGRMLLALLALLVASAAVPASAQEITPTERVRSSVVVREEPIGRPSPRVGSLRPGERATLLESIPYFYKVRLANGVEGYVAKGWTRQVESAPAALVGGALTINFLDVGQGDSTLIICPNGSTILADAGSTSGRSPDEVRQFMVEKIDGLGGDIDYLFVSHPDADHYNLLREVLDDISVGKSWFVGEAEDYGDRELPTWLKSVSQRATRLEADYFDTVARPNPDIDCGGAKVWILAAAVEHPDSRKNAMSIVLMIRYGDFEAVITGDATTATESVVMSRYPAAWLDIDVLRVGHHGSLATSTSPAWAQILSPLASVFSAGYQNTYGHPRREVVERLLPFAQSVPAHAFRDWRAGEAPGPRYVVRDEPAMTKAVYATASSRTVVVKTTGAGFSTTFGN